MRRFLMCLCIAGALLLASCGGEKSDAPAAIFRAEKITLTEGFAADYDGLSLSDGRVHVTGYDIESNKLTSLTSVILQVFSCAVDGTEADLAPLADVGQGTRRTVYTSGGGMVETETYMRTPTAVERVAIRHTDAHGAVREYDCAEVFGLDPAKIKISELYGSGGFFVHAAYDTEAGLMIVSTTGAALV